MSSSVTEGAFKSNEAPSPEQRSRALSAYAAQSRLALAWAPTLSWPAKNETWPDVRDLACWSRCEQAQFADPITRDNLDSAWLQELYLGQRLPSSSDARLATVANSAFVAINSRNIDVASAALRFNANYSVDLCLPGPAPELCIGVACWYIVEYAALYWWRLVPCLIILILWLAGYRESDPTEDAIVARCEDELLARRKNEMCAIPDVCAPVRQ